MNDTDIFKIKSNNALPSRGKILISEPFLRDATFGRSVVLLVDHTNEGSMGLIMNKQLPLLLNEVIKEFKYLDDIPIYKGGPIGTDTLFFLHTLPDVPGALSISNGLYMNGDFSFIKEYMLKGKPVDGVIKFFLGYSGWELEQLDHEIKEDTWIVSKEEITELMSDKIESMWKRSLRHLGSKYQTWSRFPQIPTLN
ncbi:YqgE/AlgH family protein [Bacteroides sp. 224]|uniref:YqgE/AlgH family protein n=1 Tax=Bacteroides sp. 224 TaxID=2302936 RepID=UPI0013D3A632|nr:YqgE/AlgH family protein [Bacteroides sp. 224]NDV64333.1 YqgE/AlgH family protein [Bacteroides sp. 224]